MAQSRRRRSNRKVAEDQAETKTEKKGGSVFGLVFWALVIAFFLRSFLVETFWIPSSSMEPTLEVGDYILVTKWTYGYNRHSLMFDPPIFKEQRFIASDPKRGDIVVFDSTTKGQGGSRVELENGGYHVIKRVIGLPGDAIVIRNGLIEITTAEGEVFTHTREENTEARRNDETSLATLYTETNPIGRKFVTRELLNQTGGDNYVLGQGLNGSLFTDGKVPEGHVFVMGDNRDQSGDSRASLGSIPMYKIIGKAQFTVFSLDGWVPRWGRFFKPLR